MKSTGFMTVEEVAVELDISASGVYKLIERGKLKAIRRSERGVRVSSIALDAYRRALNAPPVQPERPRLSITRERLVERFEEHTGMTAFEWLAAWKRDEIEDSPEHMRCTMAALALSNWDHVPEAQRAAIEPLVA